MKLFYITLCCTLCSIWSFGQTLGDYRSNGTVDFNSPTGWQVLTALPSTWTAATAAPASAAAALGNSNTITIQAAHTLRILNTVNFGSNTNFTIVIKGIITSLSAFTVNYGTGSSTVRIERGANYSGTTIFQNHNFRNLELVGTSGTPLFSFTAALKVANSLTVTNATLSVLSLTPNGNAVTVNSNGNISITGAQNISGKSLTFNISGNSKTLNFQSTLGLTSSGNLAVNFSGTGGTVSAGANFSLDNSSFSASFAGSSASPGNLNFSNTVSLSNGSSLNLNGDYARLNMNSNTLQLSGSSVNMLGTNQTLSVPNSATITLNNGSFIKLLAANGLLDLGGDVSFSGANSTNYVQLSSTSYVRRQIKNNKSFAFPIGTAGYYLPVTLNNQPSGGSPNFTVGVFTGATIDANPSGTPISKSTIVDAVWLVSMDGSNSNPVTLDLGWQNPLEGTVFSTLPNNQIGVSTLVKGSGTWSQAAQGTANRAAATFSTSVNYVPSGGVQRAFAVGQINIILPVTLSNFTGYAYNESTKLSWSGMTVSLNSRFDVERAASTSGKFEKIATIPAKATGVANYEYSDLTPSKPESYYRIKMTDENGQYFYSKTVKISFSGSALSVGNLYPSVCSSTVNLLVSSNRATQLQLSVIDMAGRVAKTQNLTIGAGSQTYSLDVSALAKGQYFLVMNSSQEIKTGRFIKQ